MMLLRALIVIFAVTVSGVLLVSNAGTITGNAVWALTGAVGGLALALASGFILLPRVLSQQAEFLGPKGKVPILKWDAATLADVTSVTYRFAIPVLFAALGSIFASQRFG